jgi:hypothetical protein
MRPVPSHPPDDLWAITSYFNPAGYGRRLANYRTFASQLGVPLVTVELAFGGAFELCKDDADTVVQLRGGDVMWQKERLLNVALQSLPPHCKKVLAIDCDIVLAATSRKKRLMRSEVMVEDTDYIQLIAKPDGSNRYPTCRSDTCI